MTNHTDPDLTDLERDEDEDLIFAEEAKGRSIKMTCDTCGFTCHDDAALIQNHSCEVELQGGTCEDYPCCGHERGDCNGRRYGSDEKIKADVYRAFHDPAFAEAMERQMEYDSYWG